MKIDKKYLEAFGRGAFLLALEGGLAVLSWGEGLTEGINNPCGNE